MEMKVEMVAKVVEAVLYVKSALERIQSTLSEIHQYGNARAQVLQGLEKSFRELSEPNARAREAMEFVKDQLEELGDLRGTRTNKWWTNRMWVLRNKIVDIMEGKDGG